MIQFEIINAAVGRKKLFEKSAHLRESPLPSANVINSVIEHFLGSELKGLTLDPLVRHKIGKS